MKGKTFHVAAVITTVMLALSACGSGSNDTPTAQTPSGEATSEAPETSETSNEATGAQSENAGREDFIIGLIGEPKTMDPSQVSDLVSYTVFYQIYDTLIQLDGDDQLQPSIAESWEFNDDGSEITINIRQGVAFWNGDPVTADDVVFTYNRAIESSFTTGATGMMDRMEKIDDYTCKLILQYPYGPVEYCLADARLCIISEKHFENVGAEGFARDPMGTGAYEYVSWDSGDKLILKANENYWKGAPAIKDITFKIITDGSTAVIALQKGEVDFVDTPPKADRQSLLDDANIEYVETEISASVFVSFNNGRAPFNDARVRKAFMMAVDKDVMVEGAVEGLGTPLNTWWPFSLGGWDDDIDIESIPYDPEGAKALLAEAGYPDGMDIVLLTTDSATYSKPTEVFQFMLSAIGVNASIEKLERTTFFDKVQSQRDYDICILASTTSVPDVDYIYPNFHSSAIDGGRNYMNVDNAKLDELLEAGRAETDPAKRVEIYTQVAELWNEEVFSGCLYTYLTPIAYKKDLQGMYINSKNRYFIHDFSWPQA